MASHEAKAPSEDAEPHRSLSRQGAPSHLSSVVGRIAKEEDAEADFRPIVVGVSVPFRIASEGGIVR
jgi:hypothetical protein